MRRNLEDGVPAPDEVPSANRSPTGWLVLGFVLAGPSLLAADGVVIGTVSGQSGAGLSGVTVSAVGASLSATTERDGHYRLEHLPAGQEYLLVASAPGFDPREESVFVVEGRALVVDFQLSAHVSETVDVTGEIPLLTTGAELGTVRLAPAQAAALPSLGERDIFRALQLLPGVSCSNETSSGLSVRGGTSDQTLVLYDGFTIYHVDHLFGYFTAFNMDAVEDVELRKGAYDARYGGRLSSVMELHGRSGPTDRFSGSLTASMLSVGATVSVPLAHRGSLLLAGRRSFQSPLYNDILDLFQTGGGAAGGGRAQGDGSPPSDGEPPGVGVAPSRMGGPGGGFGFETTPSSAFYDLNAKLSLSAGSRGRVQLSVYAGRDNLDNSSTFSVPEFSPVNMPGRGADQPAPSVTISGSIENSDVSHWTNRGTSLAWTHAWSDRQHTRVVVGGSRYEKLTDRESSGEISVSGDTSGFAMPNTSGVENAQYEKNLLDDLTFRLDHSLELGRHHRFELGGTWTRNEVAYRFDTQAPGVEADATGGDSPAPGLSQLLDQSEEGALSSLYLQDQARFGWLSLVPGLRVVHFDRTSGTYLEPRLSARLQLGRGLHLKAGWGRYTQVVNRISREDLGRSDQEFWILSDAETVPAARSAHVVAGASYERASFLFDVELFDKSLHDLSMFAPRLRPGEDIAESREDFYHGSSRTHGLEVLVQKKAGHNTGWISYTLSRTRDEFPDLEAEPYASSQDRTHELKLVDTARLGRWTLAATWIFATGRPYTAATGVSTTQIDDQRSIDTPEYGTKNAARLPAYHRLDLAVGYARKLGPAEANIGLTLFNVYDRHNVWYRQSQAFGGSLVETDVQLMGRAINAFVGVRF